MMEIIGEIISLIVQTISQLGYPGIFLLMALESSFFPFPSEVVMIPAGYLAYQGQINLAAVIALGLAGSLVGALVNYYLAVWLGRPFLERYGRYFFLTPEKMARVETFFNTHGEVSTFIGRLITVVRQYISFPAGLARMNLFRFLLFTGLGAGLWVSVLAAIGYLAGDNEELIREYSHEATAGLLILCGAIAAIYLWRHRRKSNLLRGS